MQDAPLPARTEMLDAVRRRDGRFDGRFVFAVITTGVYCRPSCSSRQARAENMRFFADCGTAEAAGFRPCRRCRPDAPDQGVASMAALARFIDAHADETITLADLAARAGLSRTHVQKAFKAAFGVSPKAYQDTARLRRLKTLLRSGDQVTGAIFEAGYGSTSRVYERAARRIGMPPAAYRAGGAGEDIVHACRRTGQGPLMMAATEKGVCFAMFGKGEDELLAALGAEFPKARLIPFADRAGAGRGRLLDRWITALDAHLDGDAPRPDLPLDLRGTAFQIRVWEFLTTIPDGATATYADVAAGIGRPQAARAAANACARNRIAVLVPCHRVLRGDGAIGGYRWGPTRKEALLRGEGAKTGD